MTRAEGARRGWEHRREREERVVQNIPADLVPLWHRVKTSLRCKTPHQCAELLVQYAHDHPRETIEALALEADRKLEELVELEERRGMQEEPGNGHFRAWLEEQEQAFERRHKLKPLAMAAKRKPLARDRKKRKDPHMPRTKSRSHTSTKLARVSAAKPLVIRQTTTKVVKAKRRHGGGGRGMLGGFLSQNRTQMGIAGLVLGFVDKSGVAANLPKLPMLGEHGTIAVAAYFLSDGGRNKLIDNVCTLAIGLAGYEFGKTGAIAGEDAWGI